MGLLSVVFAFLMISSPVIVDLSAIASVWLASQECTDTKAVRSF